MDINLKLWCHTESVLKTINTKVKATFITLCKSEGALFHQTRTLLQQMRRATLNHVKCHQDDSTSYENLPPPARLNFNCDGAFAKRQMQETGVMKESPLQYCLFEVKPSCYAWVTD